MKQAFIALLILGSAALYPTQTKAQLLKKMLSNAQNTIANHQAANGTTPGVPTRPASPSVSPADSAAAIQSFKTATGGSGQYYQYLDTYKFTNRKGIDSTFKDTMSIVITDAHFLRTDFSMLGAGTVLLGRAGMPHYSVMLNTITKTYVLHIIDTAAINRGDGMTYQVTKIGTERIQGYDCIHARMTMSKPGTRQPITEEVWTCTQVPGYATYKQLATNQHVTPQFMKALEQAGCDGFVVKMTVSGAAYSLEMMLTQVGRKDFPASEFVIPAGYTAANVTSPLGHNFQQ